jgi:hypothetical protein
MESRPAARGQVLGALTGHEGMFVIDRVRQRFGNPDFAGGPRNYDYSHVPTAGIVIWTREIAVMRLNQLPALDG